MKAQRLILEGDALRYKGDWVTNTAYNINDCVTWASDGHLYEVIKAHTSSATFDPDNPEYYKAMMANKVISKSYTNNLDGNRQLVSDVISALHEHKRVFCVIKPKTNFEVVLEFTNIKTSSFKSVVAIGVWREDTNFFPSIIMLHVSTEAMSISTHTLKADGCTVGSLPVGSSATSTTVYFET